MPSSVLDMPAMAVNQIDRLQSSESSPSGGKDGKYTSQGTSQ